MTARIMVAYALIALIALGITAAVVWFRLNHPSRRIIKERAAENLEYAEMVRAEQRKRIDAPPEIDSNQ